MNSKKHSYLSPIALTEMADEADVIRTSVGYSEEGEGDIGNWD